MSVHVEPDAAGAPALELRDLSIAFDRVGDDPLQLVSQFDLTVAPGQFHCFAGRSGSGKTSLLRVALRLTPASEGSIWWFGQQVDHLVGTPLAAARVGRVAYVDQRATLIDHLTVSDNVLLAAVPKGVSKALCSKAEELLDLLGLAAVSRRAAGYLSGGERQRVALARALLMSPSLLAVDEPTANLDRASADRVIDTLADLARAGTSVLAASHDHHLVAAATSTTVLD